MYPGVPEEVIADVVIASELDPEQAQEVIEAIDADEDLYEAIIENPEILPALIEEPAILETI